MSWNDGDPKVDGFTSALIRIFASIKITTSIVYLRIIRHHFGAGIYIIFLSAIGRLIYPSHRPALK